MLGAAQGTRKILSRLWLFRGNVAARHDIHATRVVAL